VIRVPAFRRRSLAWQIRNTLRAIVTLLLLGSVVSLLLDARTASLLRNTLLLSAATCAISLPLGTVLAWLLVRTDLPGRRAALVLFGVMLFVPLYLQAAAWQAGFGVQGWFTHALGQGLLKSMGGWCVSRTLLEGWTGAIWVHAMAALPWVVLIVGAGFWLVEPELEEQALLDGSPWQVFRHVTLRGALAAVGVATLWVVIVTAGEMTVTDLFAVRTYAEEVYTRQAVGPQPGDPPLGVMPGVVLTAWLVLAGLALAAKLAPRDRPITAGRRLVFRLARWRMPVTALVAIGLVLVVGVPLASLCYQAGVVVTQVGDVRARSWSLWKCLAMVGESPWLNRREFGWSLAVGLLAATASTAAAAVLAWTARRGGLRALAVLTLTALCLAVPGPILGLVVIRLLNRPEFPPLFYLYDRSILAPWLALTVRGLPPATLILWHAWRSLPEEMLDSAAVDGAGPAARFWRIAVPCRRSALALAWVVALAVALGDLAASVLVVPPGMPSLPVRIFGLLHFGVEDRVAGICLAMVVLFVGVAGGIVWLGKRWGAERS
jgi:iron(III) transport system permease protein